MASPRRRRDPVRTKLNSSKKRNRSANQDANPSRKRRATPASLHLNRESTFQDEEGQNLDDAELLSSTGNVVPDPAGTEENNKWPTSERSDLGSVPHYSGTDPQANAPLDTDTEVNVPVYTGSGIGWPDENPEDHLPAPDGTWDAASYQKLPFTQHAKSFYDVSETTMEGTAWRYEVKAGREILRISTVPDDFIGKEADEYPWRTKKMYEHYKHLDQLSDLARAEIDEAAEQSNEEVAYNLEDDATEAVNGGVTQMENGEIIGKPNDEADQTEKDEAAEHPNNQAAEIGKDEATEIQEGQPTTTMPPDHAWQVTVQFRRYSVFFQAAMARIDFMNHWPSAYEHNRGEGWRGHWERAAKVMGWARDAHRRARGHFELAWPGRVLPNWLKPLKRDLLGPRIFALSPENYEDLRKDRNKVKSDLIKKVADPKAFDYEESRYPSVRYPFLPAPKEVAVPPDYPFGLAPEDYRRSHAWRGDLDRDTKYCISQESLDVINGGLETWPPPFWTR